MPRGETHGIELDEAIQERVKIALLRDIPTRFEAHRNNNVKPIRFRPHSWLPTSSKLDWPHRFALLLDLDNETIRNPDEERPEREFIVEIRLIDTTDPEKCSVEILGCVTFRHWLISVVKAAAIAGDPDFQKEHLFEKPIPGIVFLSRTRNASALDPIRALRAEHRTPNTGPLLGPDTGELSRQ